MTAATPRKPRPPSAPEWDLRGLEYMPLLGGRLFGSTFDLESSDAEFRAALRLWWAAWNQVPAGSLPAEERSRAKLAGFEGEESERWRAVRDRAMHGFVQCSDGRFYHPVVSEQASIAWNKRTTNARQMSGNRTRKERERDDRKHLFAQLREAGVRPGWKTSTTELRRLVSVHFEGDNKDAKEDHDTQLDTRDGLSLGTGMTGRDETNTRGDDRDSADGLSRAPAPARDDAHTHARAEPAEVGKALKRAGLSPMTFNLSDPVLLALLEQGATVAEFEGLAVEALRREITRPWPWIMKTLEGKRADAAKVRLATAAPTASPSGAAAKRAGTIAGLTGARREHGQPDTIDIEARRVAD